MPLEGLIQDAFNVPPYQIEGPAWLKTERYALTAKLPPEATDDMSRQMMANLLAERFGLKFHRQTRDFPGYELTLAPGGIKAKPVAKNDTFPEFGGHLETGIRTTSSNKPQCT
jgi:uncharacterized protein (TIGR03435 family)